MNTPVVYCVTPEQAHLIIDLARELGAPVDDSYSGPMWHVALGFVAATAATAHRIPVFCGETRADQS